MENLSSEKKPNWVWYFTFSSVSVNSHKYVRIEGSYGVARGIMVEKFGTHWAFQYGEKEFLPQIKQYHLKELKLK